nr:proline-rich receptor-like protein kinase PERK9 [Aegilops tauschii subsp. strangulata]
MSAAIRTRPAASPPFQPRAAVHPLGPGAAHPSPSGPEPPQARRRSPPSSRRSFAARSRPPAPPGSLRRRRRAPPRRRLPPPDLTSPPPLGSAPRPASVPPHAGRRLLLAGARHRLPHRPPPGSHFPSRRHAPLVAGAPPFILMP